MSNQRQMEPPPFCSELEAMAWPDAPFASNRLRNRCNDTRLAVEALLTDAEIDAGAAGGAMRGLIVALVEYQLRASGGDMKLLCILTESITEGMDRALQAARIMAAGAQKP